MSYNLLTLSTSNISANDYYGTSYPPLKAIDGNTETFWGSANTNPPHWLKYDFGAGVTKVLGKVGISPGGNYPTVKNFTIEASNNDTNWTVLYTGYHENNCAELEYTFENTTAYRYYRIYFSDSWRSTFARIMIIELYLYEYVIEDLTYGKTVSASSYWVSPALVPGNAIDNNNSTHWAGDGSGFPYWWKIDFGVGEAKTITKYTLRSRADSYWNEIPNAFIFQGSNNDSDWTNIDTQSALSWSQAETKSFEIANTTAYRYYRLYLTSAFGGGSNGAIAEIEMMESVIENLEITNELDDTLSISDSWTAQTNPDSQNITETIDISDAWNIFTIPEMSDLPENIDISDSWEIQLSLEQQATTDTVIISDSWVVSIIQDIDFISKIILDTNLIIVTNTNPAKIISIDISDPSAIVKTIYEITGCSYALDILVNNTNGYYYVVCADGKVAKILQSNLESQSVLSSGEADDFVFGSILDDDYLLYVPNNNSTGELTLIDERTISKLNTDLRIIKKLEISLETRLDTILAKLINTDFRTVAEVVTVLSTDLRVLKSSYATISQDPINYDDVSLSIDGLELCAIDDVDLKSIVITHDIDNEISTAQFILHRVHDKLNYTNTNVASEITNNNLVVITINGVQEFSGKIANWSAESQNETVMVFASTLNSNYAVNNVNIPLTTLGSNIGLFDCLVNSVSTENPYYDTRQIIVGSNGKYWSGTTWESRLSLALTFNTFALAQSYIDNYNAGSEESNNKFTLNEPEVSNYERSPSFYKGIVVNLGTKIEEQTIRYESRQFGSDIAQEILDGTFFTQPNWTYYWFCNATKNKIAITATEVAKEDFFVEMSDWPDYFVDFNKGISNVSSTRLGYNRFVGTSLSGFCSDLWLLNSVNYYRQRKYDDIETELGYYTLGSAPYKSISCNNGQKITKRYWEDTDSGLYLKQNEGYDYRSYAKIVAGLEYQKLQTINDEVIPVTNASIAISFDAYYFYNIKLLTRINVTNTTISNIYKNTNGFPVSVKQITINFNSFTVALTCDNQKSWYELDQIDKLYPEESSNVFPETSTWMCQKWNPETMEFSA